MISRKLYLALAATLAVSAISCRSHREILEINATDTLTIVHDSIAIRDRIVKVEVPVPVVQLQNVVPNDTMSILTSDLYRSKAWLKDGNLFHTLETLPHATLTSNAVVQDTTKTNTKHEAINTKKKTTKIVEVNKLTAWQRFFKTSGEIFWSVVAGALFLFILRIIIKKVGNTT